MIAPETKALLERFSQIDSFADHHAILIGGTALAYHLGHRESFDLDICFPFSDTLPELDFLERFEEVIPIEHDRTIVDTAIDEGGDISEVMRRYIIDGVKFDIVVNPSSNIYESEILQNDHATRLNRLRIASVESIFKLKSLLLIDRNKIRDLYDLLYMMEYCGFTGQDFLDVVLRYRITYRPRHVIDLIEKKKEDPFDYEGIVNPRVEMGCFDEMKQRLLKFLRGMERT
ncbi:nucleotidyl transferase AbiEii/AbiGii toxin family protein [Hydrogenimonas sp.]